MKLNLEAAKLETNSYAEPGVHKLQAVEVRAEVIANSGTKMFQVDWQVVGSPSMVKWDNCPLYGADGNPIPFGHRKLDKLCQAAGITGVEDTEIIAQLLTGRVIEADLEYRGDTTYLQIRGDNIMIPEVSETPTETAEEDTEVDETDVI